MSDPESLARMVALQTAIDQSVEKVLRGAGDLADWLPGVVADYEGICAEDPCCIIPIHLENLMYTIQAKGYALRDTMDHYHAARLAQQDYYTPQEATR